MVQRGPGDDLTWARRPLRDRGERFVPGHDGQPGWRYPCSESGTDVGRDIEEARMATRNSGPEALRAALDALLHDGEPPTEVPNNIWASWRRSANSGLSPERFSAPYTDDGDHDGVLVRAARPVLDSLIDDLASTTVGLVLTDRRGDILDRWVPERSLGTKLDSVDLAPGFVYAEAAIGTNGIGTAIAERKPTFVRGSEHFADALTTLACAAAPIIDPRTEHVLGVVDLTCSTRDASALMLPLARRCCPRDRGAAARRDRARRTRADEAVLAGAQRGEASDARRQRPRRDDEHRR